MAHKILYDSVVPSAATDNYFVTNCKPGTAAAYPLLAASLAMLAFGEVDDDLLLFSKCPKLSWDNNINNLMDDILLALQGQSPYGFAGTIGPTRHELSYTGALSALFQMYLARRGIMDCAMVHQVEDAGKGNNNCKIDGVVCKLGKKGSLLPLAFFEGSVNSSEDDNKRPQALAYFRRHEKMLPRDRLPLLLSIIVNSLGHKFGLSVEVTGYYRSGPNVDDVGRAQLLPHVSLDSQILKRLFLTLEMWCHATDLPHLPLFPHLPCSYGPLNRNVLSTDKHVYKIFDYRNRQVEVESMRRAAQSAEHLNAQLKTFNQLSLIKYPKIDGDHEFQSVAEAISLLNVFIAFRGDNNLRCHGDLRLSNILVNHELNQCTLIDFDYSCLESEGRCYPPNWNSNINDGVRHDEAIRGKPIKSVHDCHSLAGIFGLYMMGDEVDQTPWVKVVNCLRNEQLTVALHLLESYIQQSLSLQRNGPRVHPYTGTGSPPRLLKR